MVRSDSYNLGNGGEHGESSSLIGTAPPVSVRRAQQRRQMLVVVAIVVIAAVVVAAVLATQSNNKVGPQLSPSEFAATVQTPLIFSHLQSFYNISQRFNNTRSAWKGGFNASVDYVVAQLQGNPNDPNSDYFDVSIQPFVVDHFVEAAAPSLTFSYDGKPPVPDTNILTMRFSATGDASADVVDCGQGCTADLFSGVTGKIALVYRANCTFYEKAKLAETAGAVGIIFANSQDYPLTPTNGRVRGGKENAEYVELPMIGVSYDRYVTLSTVLEAGVAVKANLSASGTRTIQYSKNIIAEMKHGKASSVVVVGSHLDSVEAGPGINDNGSGSATILQMALEMKRNNVNPVNRVRFLWFGAEELGLIGSYYYVDQLKATNPEAVANISCMLNFDMIGSPNFIRGVYDGASATNKHAANGSVVIQAEFEKRFDAVGLPWQLTPFNERSDYAAFTTNSIPAGGLFTGAEGPIGGMTEEERVKYGGIRGVAYDTCYHQACDNINNINHQVLGEMADAASFVAYELAMKDDINAFLYP